MPSSDLSPADAKDEEKLSHIMSYTQPVLSLASRLLPLRHSEAEEDTESTELRRESDALELARTLLATRINELPVSVNEWKSAVQKSSADAADWHAHETVKARKARAAASARTATSPQPAAQSEFGGSAAGAVSDGQRESKEFCSGEHLILGRSVQNSEALADLATAIGCALDRLVLPNGELSYAEIVALAGDFIAVRGESDQHRISNPALKGNTAAQQTLFNEHFDLLWNASDETMHKFQQVAKLFQAEAKALEAAVLEHPGDANPGDHVYTRWYSKWSEIKYGWAIADWLYLRRYWHLLMTNFDHFSSDQLGDYGEACRVYEIGHRYAMQTATEAKAAADKSDTAAATVSINRAFCIEAFACHFLSDAFAGGHARTPRYAIFRALDGCDFQWFRAGKAAHDQHDDDNVNGVYIYSEEHPTPWIAYGDANLLRDVNKTNRQRTVEAMVQGCLDVKKAYVDGKVPDEPKALKHRPKYAITDTRNSNPLFRARADGKGLEKKNKAGEYKPWH